MFGQGFELGLGGVGAWQYDGLAHHRFGWVAMFAESVERLIDHAGTGGVTRGQGRDSFFEFHGVAAFYQRARRSLCPVPQKEKATRFAVESADEGKKFIGILVAKPVDERESSIGTGGG